MIGLGLRIGVGETTQTIMGGVSLAVPQDVGLSESTIGEIIISWTDADPPGDGHKVYRRIQGETSWGTAIATVANAVGVYVDTTVVGNTTYEYKIVTYVGTNETTTVELGQNFNYITTQEQIQG